MDIQRIKYQLEQHEGNIPHAYQDSEGYWTIGIGHLIDKDKGGYIPEHIVDALLEYDISKVIEQLDSTIPWWNYLDEYRKEVLINMTFNLGIGNLLKFKKMLAALEVHDYETASVEMLDSKWARQVGKRAIHLSNKMKGYE